MAVIGAGIYIAYHYATPHIRAWRFRDAMTQMARLASVNSDEEMRASLTRTAEDLAVPLDARDLRIHRAPDGRIVVSATWQEPVTLDGGLLGSWTDTLYYAFEAASIERDER
ncbi:MAG TPA: hypothetical protein VM778_01070 [Gemmatimonadota bacterium]|nr:hypothetical protein [Gemmatimonadota bacterium]